MAIGASTVWRLRAGGNDANGAGFDSTVSGAGTDYSQQDAAQTSGSLGTSTASTTFTDSGGTFTSAMVGNLLRIASGTGATVGYYVITAYVSATQITLDRVSGTYTAGVWKIGGAAASFAADLFLNGNAVGNKCVAGNTIYIRGAGTDTPTSTDVTCAARTTLPSGTSSAPIKIIGENGRPYINSTADSAFFVCVFLHCYGLYVKVAHASPLGVAHSPTNCKFENCTLKLNGKGAPVWSGSPGGSALINCEVDGECTSAVAGNGIGNVTGNGSMIVGNYIHDCGGIGLEITSNGWTIIQWNIFKKCWGVGIQFAGGSAFNTISHNTIDNGQSDGIVLTSQAAVSFVIIYSNIISNHSQASKTGLKVTSGTAATSDRIASLINYNCVYNCTTAYSGISAGANDVSADPQYTNQSTGDFSLGSSSPCKGTGYSGARLNAPTAVGYLDIGAYQRQESGAAASPVGQCST